MSYLKPNTAGVYDIPSANIDTLYIKGKKFRDYIDELVFEDQLEQSEITEIKLLLEYLDTTGLNSAWLVNNDNRNAELKTLITALQNKIANIDTTALTETSILNNDNRNSVLKTRLDTAETDIDSLETRETASETNISAIKRKTDYISVVDGDPQNSATSHSISIGSQLSTPDATKAKKKHIAMTVGQLGQGFAVNYDPDADEDSYDRRNVRMEAVLGGHARVAASYTRISGYTDLNIGEAAGGLAGSSETINIGGSMSRINIGSVEDPRIGIANPTPDADFNNSTKITIGKRTTLKNTWTYLQGNFYTNESRWEDLNVTDVVTIETAAAWSIGFVFTGIPYWLLWMGLSGIPNFRYSDIVKMANNFLTNGLTKNHSIETSNDLSVKKMRVIDFTVVSLSTAFDAILARLVFQAFAVHGSHSIGSIWGRTNIYAGSGEVELRVDGGAFDWAFKNAGNCNRVFLDNDHVEVVQCNGSGGTGRLRLVAANGNIELSTATGGVRANAKKVMEITYQKQIIIGDDTTMSDTTCKMLIDTTSHTNGIKVAKGSDALLLNPDNVNSKSLTLQSGYTGTTVNTLFMNADNKLMWNGTVLGSGGGGGGGLEYYIPLANNVTNPAPSPTTQFATETYTSALQRTITQSTTAVATGILMAKYATGIITKESNPFVEGLQTIQQHLTWNQNNIVGQLYGQTWFQASASGAGAFIYDRSFTGVTITAGYQVLNGVPILAPQGLFNLTFQSVTFPGIYVDTFSGLSITMKCRLEAQTNGTWTTLQTTTNFITYTLDNQENQTITFNETFTHNQTSKTNAPTAYRMVLFLTSSPANGQIYQQTFAGSTNNELIAYKLGSTAGNTAEIRVLLYDGVNAKQTITHTSTPSLVPIELPISPPYQIEAFNNGRLGFDIYMFQPSGSVNAGHQMTFYFGDGTISHIETTINEPPAPIPTLAQVLNSGATASQPINMNTNKISGITTLEGASNGNWEVKEITAGTNIGRSVTNGNYTINNIAPVQNIAQGLGISVSIDPTTKTATITNTATAGGQVARDQLSATNSAGLVPLKLGHYAQNWTGIATAVQPADIFVSQDGRNCVYIPSVSAGNSYVQYSNDYGATWFNSNLLSFKYESICGSIAGDILYLSRNDDSTGTPPNIIYTSRLYKSTNYGITWSEITLDRTIGAANTWYNRYAARIRCSTDGSVVMVTTYNTTSVSGVPNNGTLYISTTGGASWVVRSLTTTAGTVVDCCMSANGAIMFATIEGVFGGSTDNGNGGIYRSFDYGATWTRVRTQIATGSFFFGIIKCDATGRFLMACDQSVSFPTGAGQIQTSDDFGSTWTWSGDEQARGANAAFVSPGGNLMIVAHNTGFNSAIRYSLDYGRSWTLALNFNVITTTTIQTLASNHDGSVLLLPGNTNIIYRSYEERGRLGLGAGSTDLSITPSFGGGYTLYNIPAGEVLWYSGVTTTTSDTGNIYLDDFRDVRGKIDLTQFDIRYEMDILWNYTSVGFSQCWIGLGLNMVQASSVANPTQNNAQTTWTNLIQTSFSGVTAYDQVYTSRFYCGYSGVQGTGTAYRYRTTMKGNISLVTRQTLQFLNDPAMNSRLIQNDFETNCCLLEPHTTANQFRIFTGNDATAGQHTQRGVAVWDASYDNLWNLGSVGGNDLNSGVYRLYLRFTDMGTTNVLRGAQIRYSIYRVRK